MPGTPTRLPTGNHGFRNRVRGSSMFNRDATPSSALKEAAMWLFLAPLIIILGTADAITKGRTRNWPLGDDGRKDTLR
jgi:hypothetical protein